MSEFIKSAGVYRLAIFIGILFSINALALGVIAALSGVDHWDQLTATQHIVIVSSIFANWTTTLMAFFNKTLARIEAGKPPIDTGDTQTWKKQGDPSPTTTDKSPG